MSPVGTFVLSTLTQIKCILFKPTRNRRFLILAEVVPLKIVSIRCKCYLHPLISFPVESFNLPSKAVHCADGVISAHSFLVRWVQYRFFFCFVCSPFVFVFFYQNCNDSFRFSEAFFPTMTPTYFHCVFILFSNLNFSGAEGHL